MKSLQEIYNILSTTKQSIPDEIDNLLYNHNCYFTMIEMALYTITHENPQIQYKSLSEKRQDYDFKRAVRNTYDDQCVISGYDIEECSIAHIKPFAQATSEEKYDPNNGIILTNSLHTLYDKFLFTIHPTNYTVIISDKIKNKSSTIAKYANKEIWITPASKFYLIWHYNRFNELNFN